MIQSRGWFERLGHWLGGLSSFIGCFEGGRSRSVGVVRHRPGSAGGNRLRWFWVAWRLRSVASRASGLWSGLGLGFWGNYGLNGGVSVHSERFGGESGFGAGDRLGGLRGDDVGLADGGNLYEAVTGVRQRTQVKSSSHHRPPHLPSLNLHLSCHLLQQHLTRCQPSAVELWLLL